MLRTILSVALLATIVGGCVVHDHGHHHPRYGPAVVVESGHAHSDHCGHYHHGSSWYHAAHHRHGHGCGHVHRGGIWIVAR